MNDNMGEIISKLQARRNAIDKAVEALREVSTDEITSSASQGPQEAATPQQPTPISSGMSAEGRRRLSLAMKKRWKLAKAAKSTVLVKKAGA